MSEARASESTGTTITEDARALLAISERPLPVHTGEHAAAQSALATMGAALARRVLDEVTKGDDCDHRWREALAVAGDPPGAERCRNCGELRVPEGGAA